MATAHRFQPRRSLGRTGFSVTALGIGDLADRSQPLETCVATFALTRALLGAILAGLFSVAVARRACRAVPTAALLSETLGLLAAWPLLWQRL